MKKMRYDMDLPPVITRSPVVRDDVVIPFNEIASPAVRDRNDRKPRALHYILLLKAVITNSILITPTKPADLCLLEHKRARDNGFLFNVFTSYHPVSSIAYLVLYEPSAMNYELIHAQ